MKHTEYANATAFEVECEIGRVLLAVERMPRSELQRLHCACIANERSHREGTPGRGPEPTGAGALIMGAMIQLTGDELLRREERGE